MPGSLARVLRAYVQRVNDVKCADLLCRNEVLNIFDREYWTVIGGGHSIKLLFQKLFSEASVWCIVE